MRHTLCHKTSAMAALEAYQESGQELSGHQRVLVSDGWRIVFPDVARNGDPATLAKTICSDGQEGCRAALDSLEQ